MNTIETKLRAAYHDAALTVDPDQIRQLGEPSVAISETNGRIAGLRTRRTLIPLTAAAAVALVSVLTALGPHLLAATRQPPPSGPSAGAPAGRFLVALAGPSAGKLVVHNAISGASVATIAAPARGMNFSGLATGDGVHYLAALMRSDACRTWFYQFTLSRTGRPSDLTSYRLRSVDQVLGPIALSKDNSTLAYTGESCPSARGPDLTIVTVATLQARHWSIPARTGISSFSLTAHGRFLGYLATRTSPRQPAAYLLPAGAAQGPVLRRSHLVASSAALGRGDSIASAALTPDGATMYLAVNPPGSGLEHRWNLVAVAAATGRRHIVGRYPGRVRSMTAGPFVRHALVVARPLLVVVPPPVASPSIPPAPTPVTSSASKAAPTATASSSTIPAPRPSSAGPSTAGSAGSPSPAGTRSASTTATPTPVPSPDPLSFPFTLINLRTGSIRLVHASWRPAHTFFAW